MLQMEDIMIQIENVSFQYNNSEKGALKDVSISVEENVFCYVGHQVVERQQ